MPDDPTITRAPTPDDGTFSYDPLDAGLAAAFATEATPGGWTRPPLFRDDPSDYSPIVRPDSADMPRGGSNRYQLLGEIARGGMGVVFKGRDPDLGRDLAVKVLKAELIGRASMEQRFAEEAQVGGQLQHPGIVPVYDLGRFSDGQPFFAMKLVKGRTLATCLAERPDPTHERGRWLKAFEDIAQAVAFAHARGVIHRDLKPANVMIGSFGEVQVMDWGLAKVLPHGGLADEEKASRERQRPEDEPTVIRTLRTGSGSETQAGSILGTPAYMPPEQAGGEIDKLDERADVFGLGAVLCVILTGQPPYVGETGEAVRLMAVRGQLGDAYARLDACGADAELIALAKRCLEPELANRPRHAKEVADAITAYHEAVEQRAHLAEVERAAAEARAAEEVKTRQMAEAKTQEERKRRRVQVALVGAVAVAVGLVGFGLWWEDRRTEGLRAQETLRVALEEAELLRRQTATERDVAAALDTMRAIIADARKQEDDPDQMKLTLRTARSYLERAEASVQTGAPTDTIRQQIAAAVTEVGQADKDAKLMAALNELMEESVVRKSEIEDRWSESRSAKYETAFREYGLHIAGISAEEVVAHTRAHPHRDRLEVAMYLWGMTVDKVHDPMYPTLLKINRQIYRSLREPAESHRALSKINYALEQRPNTPILLALARSPDVVKWRSEELYLLSIFLQGANQNHASETLLREAVERRPGSFLMNYKLGLNSRPPHASRYLSAAVAIRPRDGRIAYALSSALTEQGDHEGAIRWYSRAVDLDLDIPLLSSGNIAKSYAKLDRYDEALAVLRKVIRLQPKDVDTYVALYDLLKQRRAPPECLALLREYVGESEVGVAGLFVLALAKRDVGQRDLFDADLKQILKLSKDDLMLCLGIGNKLQFAYSEPGAAIPFLTRTVELVAPGLKARFLNDLGRALSDAGRVEDAIREFDRSAALDQTFALPHRHLGGIFMQRQEPVKAIAHFRKAIQLAPGGAEFYEALAWYLATGPDARFRDGKEAVRLATKACELTTWTNGFYLDTLAAAYAEAGDFEKAIEYQYRAFAFPEFEKAQGPAARKRIEQYQKKQPYRDPALAPPEVAPPPRAGK